MIKKKMKMTNLETNSHFKAQGKWLLVKPDKTPDKTEGGMYFPLVAKVEQIIGTVISAGSEVTIAQKGDKLLFDKQKGSIVEEKGEELYFIPEHIILFVYAEG